MTWQLFTLISVLGLSISVLLQRTLLHKHKTDPFAYAIVFQAIVGALLLIPAFVHDFSLAGLERYLLPAIISVICFGIGHIFYAKTLQRVEASSFSVLFATQAIWTMALGMLLLHESMTWVQVVGTVLIIAQAHRETSQDMVLVLTSHFVQVITHKNSVLSLVYFPLCLALLISRV